MVTKPKAKGRNMQWTKTILLLQLFLWNFTNGERSRSGYHRRNWKNQKEKGQSLRKAQVDVLQFVLSQSQEPSSAPRDVFDELAFPDSVTASSEPSSAPTLSTRTRVKGESNSAPTSSVMTTNVVSKIASKVKKAGDKTAEGAQEVAETAKTAKQAKDKASAKRKGVQGDSCSSSKSKTGAYGVSEYKSGAKSSRASMTYRQAGAGKGGEGGERTSRSEGGKGGKGGKGGGIAARDDCTANEVVDEGDESTGGVDDSDGTDDPNEENLDPAKASTGSTFQMLDCQAIASGNGETNSLSQEFEIEAEFFIEDNASIDDVANDVQKALQEKVATSLIGCQRRRRLQGLPAAAVAVNALFSTPVASDTGDCGPNCHPVRSTTELFFWGTASSNFPDAIRDSILQAQLPSGVSGLESIENLTVKPLGGIKEAVKPDVEEPDVEEPDVDKIQSEPESISQSIVTGRLVAISASTLVLLLLLICACCRYRSQRSVDERALKDPSAEALESHPTNNSNAASEERAWFGWLNNKNGHERILSDDDSTKISDSREVESSPSDFATSPDRMRSEFTLFQGPETVLQDDSENPRKVHVCASPSCEFCANSPPKIRFLQANEEKIEVVPSDATRAYYVNDTVAF